MSILIIKLSLNLHLSFISVTFVGRGTALLEAFMGGPLYGFVEPVVVAA
jgi:hypothetical protein